MSLVETPMGRPWHDILEIARHAPSPHNVQPWRVRVTDDTNAELWLERARALPREDETGSFLALSMGLFIESMRLIAANRGFELEDERTDVISSLSSEDIDRLQEEHVLFARLALRAGTTRSTYSDEVFLRRRTSRLPYAPEPVETVHAGALSQLADAWGQRYAQSSNPDRIERLLAWNIEAVFHDLNDSGYRNELRGWLRYTESQSRAHKDGLDARCLHQNPVELWLAFHAPRLLQWRVTEPRFRRRYRAQIGPVATMGVLAGGFWEPEQAYRSGQFLIHFWCECTQRGLSIHPYGNLVTNRAMAGRCELLWRVPDIWLEFKIGRSPEAPASRRRTVEEILLA
jgi:nitroreductase